MKIINYNTDDIQSVFKQLKNAIENETSGIIFTKGLPGSGKSYFAKELANQNAGNVIRINKDDLRLMLNQGKFSSSKENLMNSARKAMIKEILAKKVWVICDDTNLTTASDTLYNSLSTNVIKVDFMDIPIEVCMERDLQRATSVGKDVILKMWESTLTPLVQDEKLQKAVIFDIDGTLAHNIQGNRFFDPERYLVDEPIAATIAIAHSLIQSGTQVFFVSGREASEAGRKNTEIWLKAQGFDLVKSPLFMRPSRDFRKDSIIKKEIFMDNFYGKYFVTSVFDDRFSVILMWKTLGLAVFKCGATWDFDLVN